MRCLVFGLLFGIGGYLVNAVVSYFLVLHFSSNVHDRDVEAAMTGVLFYGPAGGIFAFVVGIIRGGRRPPGPVPEQ